MTDYDLLLSSIKMRIHTLNKLDDVERTYAVRDSLKDTRKLYKQICDDYKKNFELVNKTRDVKKACRELLHELRSIKKTGWRND